MHAPVHMQFNQCPVSGTFRQAFRANAFHEHSQHLRRVLDDFGVVGLVEHRQTVDGSLVLLEVLLQRQALHHDREHLNNSNTVNTKYGSFKSGVISTQVSSEQRSITCGKGTTAVFAMIKRHTVPQTLSMHRRSRSLCEISRMRCRACG